MSFAIPETHEAYAQRVGPPRPVRCDIVLSGRDYVWFCRPHEYGFNDRPYPLDWWLYSRLSDRCPMSRLEEWRARRWAALGPVS